MTNQMFSTQAQNLSLFKNNGGLNTTASSLNIEDNECTDIQNIDLDLYGAIVKRSGYDVLNYTLKSISAATKANPIVITSNGHGFSNGDRVYIYGVSGMTQLNNNYYKVSNKGTNTFELKNIDTDVDIDSTNFTAYDSGGTLKNAIPANSGAKGTGLFFYETVSGSDYLMATFGSKLYKMDNLDGTFDDVTGGITLDTAATSQVVWKTYRNTAIGTNNVNAPFKYSAVGGVATTITVNAGGTNYSVGDLIFLTGSGDGTAVVKVATLSGSAVATITLVGGGSGYTAVTNGITTNAPESPTLGSGCTLNVTAVTTNAVALGVPTGLTRAKALDVFYGFTFLGNVTVSGLNYNSRLYWSYPGTIERWWDADWVDVNRDDGQEIVAVKTLGDRLVIFKERSIWIAMYTGDTDVPFTFSPTPSNVGCIAKNSIQEIENGLVFLSYDGLYYFDGSNSKKISTKLNKTFRIDLQHSRYDYAVSGVNRSRNQYMIAITEQGDSTNNSVFIWDYVTQAFYRYTGMECNAMTSLTNNNEEYTYFLDYSGFCYQMNTGTNDYPLGVPTAIDSYFKTKWFSFGDLVNVKAVPQIVTYTDYSNSTMTIGYSYDFDEIDQYTLTIPLSTAAAVYGTAMYDSSVYAGSGGFPRRTDLIGRGRVMRFTFSNNVLNESFKLSGYGLTVFMDTSV